MHITAPYPQWVNSLRDVWHDPWMLRSVIHFLVHIRWNSDIVTVLLKVKLCCCSRCPVENKTNSIGEWASMTIMSSSYLLSFVILESQGKTPCNNQSHSTLYWYSLLISRVNNLPTVCWKHCFKAKWLCNKRFLHVWYKHVAVRSLLNFCSCQIPVEMTVFVLKVEWLVDVLIYLLSDHFTNLRFWMVPEHNMVEMLLCVA